MARPIYLDHQATTPVDPRVVEVMTPYFTEIFGNPASRTHQYGWAAESAVTTAREQVAALIGSRPREIVFTSGATESNNLAIKGVARARAADGGHIVTCATEHKAVLDPCSTLEEQGCHITRLGVDREGRVDLDELRRALRPGTILVSIMAANNEIGVIHPVAEIAEIVSAHGAAFHVDAAQAAGKIPLNVREMGIDLLSLTAHKFYGPKGAGALYVNRGKREAVPAAELDGGGHERGLRSGTLNVPGIVGLGAAAELARADLRFEAERQRPLRDALWDRFHSEIDGTRLNGPWEDRLSHNLNVRFPGIDSESLLASIEDLAVSAGSACTTYNPRPSHVLEAMGQTPEEAKSSIRFGLGRDTTEEDIHEAADRVIAAVIRLRTFAPAAQT